MIYGNRALEQFRCEHTAIRIINELEVTMPKKKDVNIIHSSTVEYLTYVAAVGDKADSMEMHYEDENTWLTQNMMVALYDVDVRTISEHIKKIIRMVNLLRR